MFCRKCGFDMEDADRFCRACGAQAGGAAPQAGPEAAPWQTNPDFRVVLNDAKVRALIDNASGTYDAGMSSAEFLKSAGPLLKLAGVPALPLSTMAELLPDWYANRGVKTGKSRTASLPLPIGRAIAATGCAFAARSMPLIEGKAAADGSVLTARIGSSIWHFGGELSVSLRSSGDTTLAEATTLIPGQIFDWGSSTRLLDKVLTDISRYATLQS